MTGPLNLKRHPKAPAVERPWDDPRLDEGIALYNGGHHWHAHEAWEPLWMGLEGGDKLFLQGLIMSAAMLHQYARKVQGGVRNHWANVQMRLPPHRPAKWGVDVEGLLAQLEPYARDAEAGRWSLEADAVRIRRIPADAAPPV